MLIRSPRKLAILSFFAFGIVLFVLHDAPWTTTTMSRFSISRQQLRLALFDTDGSTAVDTSAAEYGSGKEQQQLTDSVYGDDGVKAGTASSMLPWQKLELERQNGKKKSVVDGSEDANRTRLTSVEEWKEYLRGMLKWPRPEWEGHWPPFGDYKDREYDPNRWEEFAVDDGIYEATHEKLESTVAAVPEKYDPFPAYNSKKWREQWKGEYVACVGPRGKRMNVSTDDQVYVYRGIPDGAPKVFSGSYDVVGLDGDVCFDRYSRYGAYGFGGESIVDWNGTDMVPEWESVDWGRLQEVCVEENQGRFQPEARGRVDKRPSVDLPVQLPESSKSSEQKGESPASLLPENVETDIQPRWFTSSKPRNQKHHSRTAVLIRAWTGYTYEPNDIMAIRAMITELSLASGGEYSVFLFVHVKDSTLNIFHDADLYNQVLSQSVPPELRSITILWSENIFPSWYPKVEDWQVYWQQFMCLQWFSLTHPEFDYIWNWETDARYIGHHYHFLESVTKFADAQPRKLLWERNKRFYIPAIHGSWHDFVNDTHNAVLNASAHSLIPEPVWGPQPWLDADPPQEPLGPPPPTSFADDDFTWGAHEPADLITLLPIWDPRNTSWSYKDKIWNYVPGVRPVFTETDHAADWFTHEAFLSIPRRVFINTVARLSKNLLLTMHNENLVGRSMQAEMWPATVALQHGLKAVYAPHPIFADRHWPTSYAEAIFDAAHTVDASTGGVVGEVQGAWSEQADSPYNHDREYNFQGWSWYYASKFARKLYRRWLGWAVEREVWGLETVVVGGEGGGGNGDVGRMCVPGMLLHPVKGMGEGRVRV